jgi:hypothetical protein
MPVDSLETIVNLLASSLGDDAAREIVSREAGALGLGNNLTTDEALRLLGRIEASSGPASLAARLAIIRVRRSSSATMPRVAPAATDAPPPSPRAEPIVLVAEIVELFAKSLGDEKARAVVDEALGRLGLTGPRLRRSDASKLLDIVSDGGGLPGSVARFAKVRFLLR